MVHPAGLEPAIYGLEGGTLTRKWVSRLASIS